MKRLIIKDLTETDCNPENDNIYEDASGIDEN